MFFPEAHIAYLANTRTSELLRYYPKIDEVFVFDKGEYRTTYACSRREAWGGLFRLLRVLRAQRFDIVFDLSLSRQYGFFLALLGIPVRVGYDFKKRGMFLTHKKVLQGYCEKHIAAYYLELLPLIQKTYVPCDTEIEVPEGFSRDAQRFLAQSSGSPLIAVAPGGGLTWGPHASYKQWDRARFKEVVCYLTTRYRARVLLFGDSFDEDLCDDIARDAGPFCINVCAKTTLMTMAALLKESTLLVSNDSGILHLAVALGLKTISLYGPVDERVYGPYAQDMSRHSVLTASCGCRPCYQRFKFEPCGHRRCLEEISFERVRGAIDSSLKS